MRINKISFFCLLLIITVCNGLSFSSELMISASQYEKVNITGYYVVSQETLDVKKGDNFLSSNGYEVRNKQFVMTKLSVSPIEKIVLYGKVGLGNYSLEIPSNTIQNKYYGDPKIWKGKVWGLGMKYLLFPDTMVTPAIALDVSYTQYEFPLEKLEQAGNTVDFSGKLSYNEIQGTFFMSKRFELWEPYMGCKVFYTQGEAVENISGEKIKENCSSFSPFIGLKLRFYPLVSMIIETGFVGENVVSAGLSVGF